MVSRDRRALLAGTVVVVVAMALRGIPDVIGALRAKEEAVLQQVDFVTRARLRVRNLSRLDDSLRVLNEIATALPSMLLVGGDSETASADLMRRVRDRIGSDRLDVLGFEPRPLNEVSGPLALAGVTARVETDFVGLLQAIDAVEGDPSLAVETIDVGANDPHGDGTSPERLTAVMGVSGWYRRPTEQAVRSTTALPR